MMPVTGIAVTGSLVRMHGSSAGRIMAGNLTVIDTGFRIVSDNLLPAFLFHRVHAGVPGCHGSGDHFSDYFLQSAGQHPDCRWGKSVRFPG
jgi:hypothetical protein